jgi:hypothetical protein
VPLKSKYETRGTHVYHVQKSPGAEILPQLCSGPMLSRVKSLPALVRKQVKGRSPELEPNLRGIIWTQQAINFLIKFPVGKVRSSDIANTKNGHPPPFARDLSYSRASKNYRR